MTMPKARLIHHCASSTVQRAIQGEMWLAEQGGPARRLAVGDRFHLQANVPHEERYGPQGAIYWVARRAG
jgi:quercetin dioxygenase-like cupin family protein